jgi:hypothetical protein
MWIKLDNGHDSDDAQMILKLIINRTNTFLRFQVSRYVPFLHWRTWNVPLFHSKNLVTLVQYKVVNIFYKRFVASPVQFYSLSRTNSKILMLSD